MYPSSTDELDELELDELDELYELYELEIELEEFDELDELDESLELLLPHPCIINTPIVTTVSIKSFISQSYTIKTNTSLKESTPYSF